MSSGQKPQNPKNLGEYYLLDRIAVGGMAEIFKAKTYGVGGFEKLVAIKRILPHHAQNQEFITMLIDEAKIAVALNHVNIVQVYDLGKFENDYFIAMEFVEGRDLRTLMRRCKKLNIPITLENAVYIILEICKGLDYAHRKTDKSGRSLEVVHRDISPQNILISFEGEVKIVDFGIAKAANKVTETEAGILKGKFSYMSPEQAMGKSVDRLTDIFSAGLIMYELLAGEKLFQGQNHVEILEKIRATHIEPPFLPSSIPSELEYILGHALAHDIPDRYQWASEFQVELTKFLYSQSLDFTARNLADLMKRIFNEELQEDRKSEKVDFELDEDTRSLMLKSHSESLVSKTDMAMEDVTNTGEIEMPAKNRTIIQKFQKMLRRDYIPSRPRSPEADTDRVPMQSDFPPPYRVIVSTKPIIEVNRTVNEHTEQIAVGDIKTTHVQSIPQQQRPLPAPRPSTAFAPPSRDDGMLKEWFETFQELSLSRKVAGLIALSAILLLLVSLVAFFSRSSKNPDKKVVLVVDTANQKPTPAAKKQPVSPTPAVSVTPEPRYGAIEVNSTPSGARVYIDKKLVGETPLRFDRVAADAAHVMTLQKDGFEEYNVVVRVSPEDSRVFNKVLEEASHILSVTSSPSGAQIFLNGAQNGVTPRQFNNMTMNSEVMVVLRLVGHRDFIRKIRVGTGEASRISARLEPLDRRVGTLFIDSEPTGAGVVVNGRRLTEVTPVTLDQLRTDQVYAIQIVLPNYEPEDLENVRVDAEQIAIRKVTLRRLKARLTVMSDPPNASVILNGRLVGETPLAYFAVDSGVDFILTLKKPGYKDQIKTLRMEPRQTQTLKFKLDPSSTP